MRTVEFKCVGDQIVPTVRDYQGVERPDYTDLDGMSIIAAEAMFINLQELINKAKDNAARYRVTAIAKLEADIKHKQDELDRLKREPAHV